MQPEFLCPHASCSAVEEIRENAAEGAENHVEEAEHGGPAAGAGFAKCGEVFEVVGAEDGVDG